jgi:hypothetical protein
MQEVVGAGRRLAFEAARHRRPLTRAMRPWVRCHPSGLPAAQPPRRAPLQKAGPPASGSVAAGRRARGRAGARGTRRSARAAAGRASGRTPASPSAAPRAVRGPPPTRPTCGRSPLTGARCRSPGPCAGRGAGGVAALAAPPEPLLVPREQAERLVGALLEKGDRDTFLRLNPALPLLVEAASKRH